MPVAYLHLIELKPFSVTAERFLTRLLHETSAEVILASQIRFDVVTASLIDADELKQPWHFLYVDLKDTKLPDDLIKTIARRYTVQIGIPSRITKDYQATNQRLLSAPTPPLTGSLDQANRKDSAQALELSAQLERDAAQLAAHYTGPVTQLNLLHFNPGQKAEYGKYGQAFAKVGGRRGGNAKLVGTVVKSDRDSSKGKNGEGEGGWWNEIALVHYPSIVHFNDMLAGADYQEANARHRQKALRDTVLICTTEYDLAALRQRGSKL